MSDKVADAIIAKLRERKEYVGEQHSGAQRRLAMAQSEADGIAKAYYEACDALAIAESVARQAEEVPDDE